MAKTLLALALAFVASVMVGAQSDLKTVCYYDSRAHWRHGRGRMRTPEIDPTLCTHLVYGPTKLDPDTAHLLPYNDQLDLEGGRGNFMEVAGLKARNPHLIILLGVGIWPSGVAGGLDPVDPDEPDYFASSEPYQTLIEDHEKRDAFVESARALIRRANFDGIDLAWPFPKEPYQKDRGGTLGQWWHSVRRKFGAGRSDKKPEEDHVIRGRREGFASLIREMKHAFSGGSRPLKITVSHPPVTNITYFDVMSISSMVEQVHVMAFDYITPFRQKTQARQPAPLYVTDPALSSADATVRKWLSSGAPGRKLVLGIPAFGRTWRLPDGVEPAGAVPPATAEGPGAAGPHTNIFGLLAYYEICRNITHSGYDDWGLTNFPDPTRKTGPYATRVGSHEPLWVGYDDLDFAGAKATYVKSRGLGGVAMWDLSLDDFGGVCTGTKFPLLRAIKAKLV